jgi:hypothetical protein
MDAQLDLIVQRICQAVQARDYDSELEVRDLQAH